MSDTLTARLVSAHRRLVEPLEYGTGTDCTRAVYACLVDVYGPDVREFRADLHIADHARPWSNVEALVAAGLGVECVEGHPHAGRWHVVQGWRRLRADGRVPALDGRVNGHTFLYCDGRVLEANVRRPWDRRLTWGEIVGAYRASDGDLAAGLVSGGVRVVALREP